MNQSKSDQSDNFTSLAITQDFPPIPGGVSVYVDNVFKNWYGKVTILAPQSDIPFKDNNRSNVTVKRISLDLKRNKLNSFIKRQISLFLTCRKIIIKDKIHYVHCTHIASGLTALLLKKVYYVPYVLYTYGSEITAQHGIFRKYIAGMILRNAIRIVTMSHFTKQAIMNFGIDKGKIRFLVGVEVNQLSKPGSKSATKKKYDINSNPIILTIARLVPHKGIDTVIKALPEVVKKYPELLYLVVGDGPYRDDLEKLSRKCRVEKNVKFIGNIPHERMQSKTEAFYSLCDLFVMASRNLNGVEAEGFGLVFLEAGLSKKAVIGGKSGGIGDAVIDGVTGRLVDPLDPCAISQCIITMLTDMKDTALMGKNNYKRSISQFDWKKNVEEWEAETNRLFM